MKDLSFAGTKDKRGVTVQKIALRRTRLTMTQVWKSVNGITQGWKTEETAVTERGDRGIRIGDMKYSPQYLELGMLKGNHFVITLR
jgi:tRNA pseudouridine13 synthase